MEKIGFILLHYKLSEVTIRCVDSILKFLDCALEIVIIDNASNDNSGDFLKKKYSSNDNVKVIILKESTGFSYGNNIGYDYLKKNSDCKFIIACNNDLIFEQESFVKVIEEIYDNESFDVLGPDIRNIGGGHQSPLLLKGRTSQQIYDYVEYCKNVLKKAKYIAFKKMLSEKFHVLYKIYKKNTEVDNEIDYTRKYDGAVLCGACLIFSEKFIEKHDKLFDPEVPFYHEEEILWYQLKKNNEKIIYRPELYVIHDHSRATRSVNNSYLKHTVFEMSNTIKSGEVLYSIVLDYEQEQ